MKHSLNRDSHLPRGSAGSLNPRKSPKQARSAVTVDAIFDGTVQVLLAVGSDRLTTTRVAHRAGVSVGTLYQYYPNKRALLLAILERHLSMLADAVELACAAHRDRDAGTMAAAVVTAYLRAKAEQRRVSRALYLIVIELDAGGSVAHATGRAEKAIADMLVTAPDASLPDPGLVAQVLLSAVAGAVRAFYEREAAPEAGGPAERELIRLCRSYVTAAGLDADTTIDTLRTREDQ